MADHKLGPVDPKEVERANALWASFIAYSKWSGVTIAVLLLVLALVFVG